MQIELKNMHATSPDGRELLNDINFCAQEGEFLYIIGRVGAGKSSLLKVLYGELKPDGGEAQFLDYNLRTRKRKHIPCCVAVSALCSRTSACFAIVR